MRTLRPGQQIRQFVTREGSDFWLTVRVAGQSFRGIYTRTDLMNLAQYILQQIREETDEHTSQAGDADRGRAGA